MALAAFFKSGQSARVRTTKRDMESSLAANGGHPHLVKKV
jgi:hypothetical protein